MSDNIQTGHNISSALRIDHSIPLLIMGSILFLIIVFKKLGLRALSNSLGFDIANFKVKTEDISYYEALNQA
jgi:hypothetical protein